MDDSDAARRSKVLTALKDPAQKNNRHHVDVIIALGMAKEGFDWIWCEHALTIGYGHTRVQPAAAVQNSRSAIWTILRTEVRQHSSETQGLLGLADMLGPTPSAGGMISKVLLTIPDREAWTGEFLPPGARPEGERFVDVIVKIEEPQYDGLLDLESLCLDVHRAAGFDVPRSWRLDIDGLRLLAIERFDRDHGIAHSF